jgi:hypothetical protein
VVSRAAKLLGYRLYRDRSRTSCRPPQRWVGLFSACVPPVPGVRSDSKEVCAHHEVVGMSFARVDGGGGGQTETEVGAHMKVLIGVDPHKASRSPSLRSTKPQASS